MFSRVLSVLLITLKVGLVLLKLLSAPEEELSIVLWLNTYSNLTSSVNGL